MDPDKQGWFPIVAAVSILVLLMAGVFAFLPEQMQQSRQYTYRAQIQSKMMMVSRAMDMYASSNGGKLPDHIGKLLAAGHLGGDAFLDPRNPTGVPPTYSGEARPGLVYRFGDLIFLYDPTHTVHPSISSHSPSPAAHQTILMCSTLDHDPDYRVFGLASGFPAMAEVGGFATPFAMDNTQRKAAGLPEVDIKAIEALDKPAASTGATP